jgi:hypothetical protein
MDLPARADRPTLEHVKHANLRIDHGIGVVVDRHWCDVCLVALVLQSQDLVLLAFELVDRVVVQHLWRVVVVYLCDDGFVRLVDDDEVLVERAAEIYLVGRKGIVDVVKALGAAMEELGVSQAAQSRLSF